MLNNELVREGESSPTLFIGIDLGTTYSSVSIFDTLKNQPVILGTSDGMLIDSTLFFSNQGKLQDVESASTIHCFQYWKSCISKGFGEVDKAVIKANNGCLKDRDGLPVYEFEIQKRSRGTQRVGGSKQTNPLTRGKITRSKRFGKRDKQTTQSEDTLQQKEEKMETTETKKPQEEVTVVRYMPEEIGLIILKKLRKLIENYAGISEDTTIHAVITIPAAYTQAQKEATITMAKAAKIDATLLAEPTAAALDYFHSIKDTLTTKQRLLIFDFGGGTLDVDLIDVSRENGKFDFNVLASNGNSDLGGRNFDLNMNVKVKEMIEETLEGEEGFENFEWTPKLNTVLRSELLKVKMELSREEDVIIDLNKIVKNSSQTIMITRKEFDEWNAKEYKNAMTLIDECFKNTKGTITEDSVDKVLLIGGTSQIPMIRQMLSERFGKEKIVSNLDLMEAVVKGGCIHAYENCSIENVLPADIKLERFDGTTTTIFERNTRVPVEKRIVVIPEQDGATELNIKLYEGNYSVATMNQLIYDKLHKGLAGVDRDEAYIELIFSCDKYASMDIKMIDYNIEDDDENEDGVVVGNDNLQLRKCQSIFSTINEIISESCDDQTKKEFEVLGKELVDKGELAVLLSTLQQLKTNSKEFIKDIKETSVSQLFGQMKMGETSLLNGQSDWK